MYRPKNIKQFLVEKLSELETNAAGGFNDSILTDEDFLAIFESFDPFNSGQVSSTYLEIGKNAR
jgi:hypothetical protein